MILFVSLSLLIISRTYHTTVRMVLIKKRTTVRLRFDLCLLEYFGVVRLYKPLVRAQYTRRYTERGKWKIIAGSHII